MLKSHGITAETPKNLLFSAAVLYKNLKWSETQWQGTVLGATSGGTKVSIAQEYMDAELDGATVKIKGAKNKVGEEASATGNFTEITEGILVDALHLEKVTDPTVKGFSHYKTKSLLVDEDYLENIGIVGTLNDGRQCIVIMENALCTSAFELDTKNKTQATYECVFECHATFEQDALNYLPIHIYFPTTDLV